MAKFIARQMAEGVALLKIANPPVNALSQPVRAELFEHLQTVLSDDTVTSVVICGGGGTFSAGGDIRELERAPEEPFLRDMCTVIENAAKPVVAVLEGVAFGGAFEIALACHARVALHKAQIGFPDVALGLPPGAGATQRLPRLVGAKVALELLLGGKPVLAGSLELSGLFSRLVSADAPEAAQDLAAKLASTHDWARTSEVTAGFEDAAAYQSEIRQRRGDRPLAGLSDVHSRIIDCVEAALLLPFEAGEAFERAAYEDSYGSDQAVALRHAYFAERRAGNMPELARAKRRGTQRLGLIGGGPVAASIAVSALLSGLDVIQFERTEEASQAAFKRVSDIFEGLAAAGGLPKTRGLQALERLRSTQDLKTLSAADVLLEAVADNATTKAQVFTALDQVAGEGALLLSHSVVLPVAPMSAVTKRPGDVAALHFHAPAHIGNLAEVICGPDTSDQAVATAVELARRLGKTVVHVQGGGGLGERMQAALRDACIGLLVEGADPALVDQSLRDFGFANGPFQQMDMLGLDVCLARGQVLATCGRVPRTHLGLLAELCEAGRSGVKSGQGFYDWSAQSGARHVDPTLWTTLDLAPSGLIGSSEVLLRVIAAMANEGARLLREDVALRPSDIDTVMIAGYHYPRWRGGPMKAADLAGLFRIQQTLERLSKVDPVLYTPDPGFAGLVRNGETFDALNRIGRNRRKIPD